MGLKWGLDVKRCDGEMVICFDADNRVCFQCGKCGLYICVADFKAGKPVKELLDHEPRGGAKEDLEATR
jgi:hypothetical protein